MADDKKPDAAAKPAEGKKDPPKKVPWYSKIWSFNGALIIGGTGLIVVAVLFWNFYTEVIRSFGSGAANASVAQTMTGFQLLGWKMSWTFMSTNFIGAVSGVLVFVLVMALMFLAAYTGRKKFFPKTE